MLREALAIPFLVVLQECKLESALFQVKLKLGIHRHIILEAALFGGYFDVLKMEYKMLTQIFQSIIYSPAKYFW